MTAVFCWGMAATVAALVLYWRHVRRRDWDYMSQMVGMMRLRSDAACLLRPDGRVAWVNEAYGEITGFGGAALTDSDWFGFLSERVADSAPVAAIDSAMSGRRELRIDLMFRLARGEERCMIVELHPLRKLGRGALSGRSFTGYLVVQVDIDQQRRERKMTQLALRDRQAVLDILDRYAIVTETDLQGRITKVNDRFLTVSGYRAEEVIGQRHSMFTSGTHDAPFWREMWRTVSRGGIWHGEICNRAKDGSLYWLDSVIAPMLGEKGRPVKYMSIRSDITNLKLSLDMLERTGKIASVGGWYYLPENRKLHLTRGTCNLLGLSERVMNLDRVQALIQRMMPQQWSAYRAQVRHTMESGEPFSFEVRLVLMGGRAIWVNISGEVQYQQGKLYRLVGAMQDVSAQVEARLRVETSERVLRSALDALDEAFVLYDADERLVLCNDRYREIFGDRGHRIQPGISAEAVLELAVEAAITPEVHDDAEGWRRQQRELWFQPTFHQQIKLSDGRCIKRVGVTTSDGMRVLFWIDVTDLHQALEEADAASRSKSRFLANMSHEIRTPMNAIMGMMQLIEHTGASAEQRELLRKMEGAAHSLLDILNDILDFSKVEAGMMLLDTEPFKLADLLADVSTIMSGTLGGKRLELVYELDPAVPPLLLGDALRLKQILINLGGNAVKFTARGEVRLQLSCLRHSEQGVLLEFAVQDTGIGISEDAIKHIFTGFNQAEASISRRYGGTGLGLTISHRLVELMGGQLRVRSEIGRGSRFWFQIWLQPVKKFPADIADVALAPPRQSNEQRWDVAEDGALPPALAGKRALLLEPHPLSRTAIGKLLERCGGWQVAACVDAASALAALDDEAPPQLALLSVDAPGYQPLLARLRAEPGLPGPVILLLSSSPRPPHDGMPMLYKPISFSMIQHAIQRRSRLAQSDSPTQPCRLAGIRLLLVEDNEINQDVAIRLLAREGARISVVSDGLQSIQALDAAPDAYDLVLMDMQMPVMDGLQATQAIRSESSFDRLPIIAMTANAMPSDRDACLEAGMNGHIGKPFHLEELVDIILRHTGRTVRADVAPAPEADATPSAPGDAALLDVADALQRLGQDRAFYSQLLHDFAPASRRLVARITWSLAEGEWADARDAAHQLKSTAAATGARRLTAACAAIEQGVGNGAERPALTRQAAGLPVALDEALAAQQAWLLRHDGVVETRADDLITADNRVLESDLAELAAALQTNDMAELDLFDALLARHGADLSPQTQALCDAMDAFDTDTALAIVQAWLEERHGA
ncbi:MULTISPECIES: response regulator [unclassified Brenneria]|uniref:response regulator n=1 Tax=unclassified Brenneria TaxID=2634434 RepID=UPI0018F06C29|nr:response regulator [Brenneria sp. L3-3C-1]MBJ7221042.1 response regulator [Brenneria sp. L3-3C-1]MEE3642283.1 response regulator [Brenneria sp. L3_3C_1]